MESIKHEGSRLRRVEISEEIWPIDGVFTISRGASTTVCVVVVTIKEGDAIGRGEGVPYSRYGETIEGVLETLHGVAEAVSAGMSREALQSALPPGAARNALDCALWDLEAHLIGRPVWELAGLPRPEPLITAFTLSLDEPHVMEERARTNAARPLLKLKLGSGKGDLERLAAVRRGAPDSRIIVDANEGWTPEAFRDLMPRIAEMGVAMIEQPLPADEDESLADLPRSVPVCADESCHDRGSLTSVLGRYDMVNIKLDKTGGLTEALALKAKAIPAGLEIMVGMMVSTSLSVAPAMIVAQGARVVDLDGPLLLARDRSDGMDYEGSTLSWPTTKFWGD